MLKGDERNFFSEQDDDVPFKISNFETFQEEIHPGNLRKPTNKSGSKHSEQKTPKRKLNASEVENNKQTPEDRKEAKRKKQKEVQETREAEHQANIDLPDMKGKGWHSSSKVKDLLQTFDISKPPKRQELKDTELEKLKNDLREWLNKCNGWFIDIIHTGSVYEGLKINDGIEFDLMFMMNGDQFGIEEIPKRSGYAYLYQIKNKKRRSLLNKLLVNQSIIKTHQKRSHSNLVKKGTVVKNKCVSDNDQSSSEFERKVLSPELVISKFQSVIQKFINEKKNKKKWKLRRHGPAIQLDVMKEDDDELHYSVDLVPCYEIDQGEERVLFVPKPPKSSSDLVNAWRLSFSQAEKQRLKRIDENNDCRKLVVRFLKGLSKQETTLNAITSYYWKTILFHVMDKRDGNNVEWKNSHFQERMFELLGYMEYFVQKKTLPNYFRPEMNLFEDMSKSQNINISKRLKELYDNEKKFCKAIENV